MKKIRKWQLRVPDNPVRHPQRQKGDWGDRVETAGQDKKKTTNRRAGGATPVRNYVVIRSKKTYQPQVHRAPRCAGGQDIIMADKNAIKKQELNV